MSNFFIKNFLSDIGVLQIIKKYWLIVVAICIFAFSESAFNVNFDLIGFVINTTPIAVIFIVAALSGVIDTIASWVYPKYFLKLSDTIKFNILILSFLSIFSISAILSILNYSNNAYYLPILAFVIDFFGIWWAIFIASYIRRLVTNNEYGQTMAALKGTQ